MYCFIAIKTLLSFLARVVSPRLTRENVSSVNNHDHDKLDNNEVLQLC